MKRKQSKMFYLSVEGDSERYYFNWLQKLINRNENIKYTIKFKIRIDSPTSYAKGVELFEKVIVYHVIDYESSSPEHVKKFNNELKLLKEAKKLNYQIKDYKLAYCNFTFELWLILHLKQCFKSFNSRKDYLTLINDCFETKYESLEEFKKEINFKRCLERLTLEDVKRAIDNAKAIQNYNRKHHKDKEKKTSSLIYFTNNPSLNIHELIELILTSACIY
mgnify:CR=1 FL=1